MNEILRIVAHEGQSGSYTTYWWEDEGNVNIFFDDFLEQNFVYDNYLGFQIVPTPYHYANFYPEAFGSFGGQILFNVPSDWAYDEYPFFGIAASNFWLPTATGITIQMNSISNDGTKQGVSSESIHLYPQDGNNNAGYEWYFTFVGGELQNHQIMPSMNWTTGKSYNSSLGTYSSGLVRKDGFSFLPDIQPYFIVTNANPFSFDIEETPIDTYANYFRISVSDRWLDVYDYKSYNNYGGWTTSNSTIGASMLEVGSQRLSFPVAATSSVSNKYWNYVNSDYLHKYMTCDVTGNTYNEDLSLLLAPMVNSIIQYDVVPNQSLIDVYRLRNNYDYYGGTNMPFNSVYLPFNFQEDGNFLTNAILENYSDENFLYARVFDKPHNFLYAPTILSLDVFTSESVGKSLSFRASLSCPGAANNDYNHILSSYIDGTWDTSSTPTGEHGNAAISQTQVPDTLEASPQILSLYNVGLGQWHKTYNQVPVSAEFEGTSIAIVDGHLNFRKSGDNAGRARITCLLRLQNATTHRYYFKNSKKTEYNNTSNHSYRVRIYDGNIAAQEYLIHDNTRDLTPSQLLISYNTTNISRLHRETFDLEGDFNTPVEGRVSSGNNNFSLYRVVLEGLHTSCNLFFEFIKFSTNVIGVTEESKEYIARRFTEPFNSDDSIAFSMYNSRLTFKLHTDLPKGRLAEDTSLYRKAEEVIYRVRAASVPSYFNPSQGQSNLSSSSNTRHMTLTYPSGTSVTGLTLIYTDDYLNNVFTSTQGSLTFENQPNGSSTTAQVFGYQNGVFNGQALLDNQDLLSGGVIDLSNVEFAHFHLEFNFRFTADDGSGGQPTGFAGQQISVHLLDQTTSIVNNWLGNPVTVSTDISTFSFNNPSATNNVTLNSSANYLVSGGLTVPIAMDGTDFEGNSVNNTITSLRLAFTFPNHTSGSTDGYRISIHPIDFKFTPLAYNDTITSPDLSPWVQWQFPISVFADTFEEGMPSNTHSLIQRRHTRTIRTASDRPENYFEFAPMDFVPQNDWGFYLDDEVFEIEGKIDKIGRAKDLSFFADTFSYRQKGYTRSNIRIHELEFGTNEWAFITRKNETPGGNEMRMYWNPVYNNLYQNGITAAPCFYINIPEFASASSTGNIDVSQYIGTTPTLVVWITSYTNTSGTASAMDDLIVQSGSNHHVIPAGTVGQHVINTLEIDSDELLFKIGTWSLSEQRIIDGVDGADISFRLINYNLYDETISVFTEPTFGQGQGLTVKSNTETVVPFSNENYRYYVVTEQDYLDSTNGYISEFLQGQTGTVPTTATAFTSSQSNTEIINSAFPQSVIASFITALIFQDPGSFTDDVWHLPSKDELTLLQSALGGTGLPLDGYSYSGNLGHWSSSTGTTDPSKIWVVRLDTGQSTEVSYSATGGYRMRLTKIVESQEFYNVGDTVDEFGGIVWRRDSITSPEKIVKIIKEADVPLNDSSISMTSGVTLLPPFIPLSSLTSAQTITFDTLIQATSESDGLANTQFLNLALGDSVDDLAFEIALAYSDGTYDDWYIPSTGEWNMINQSVGRLGVGVNQDLIDLTTSPEYFYCSTLTYDSSSGSSAILQQVFDGDELGIGGFQQDSVIGFTTQTGYRMKVIREVTTTDNVSIGDLYQGGRVFNITPIMPAMISPSIERWFSTVSLLSLAGFSTDDWGTLNNIEFRVQFGAITSGNKIRVQHNLSTPADSAQSTPTGSVGEYVWPYEDVINTSGLLHTVTINQPLGTTNQNIQSGNFVGFKLVFENDDPNQFLDLDVLYVAITISRSYLEEDVIHNHREEATLDLYKEFDFNTTYAVKDFTALAKTASDYSKTIEIPATNINKNVFGSISNIKGGNNIDVASGAPVTVYKGGATIFQGLAFLQSSIYNDYAKEETLEMVLRGGNASLFSLLKDIRLGDITKLNVKETFSTTAAYMLPLDNDSKILFPLVDCGKLDVNENNQPVLLEKNICPAFSLWDVMSAIFDHVKYSVNSEFLDFDDEFSTGEFSNDFQSLFKRYIGVSSYPKINERDINKSKIMLTLQGTSLPSRRGFQTNFGETFVGNHDVNNAHLDKTPIIRRWGPQSGSGVRYLGLDYRPIAFEQFVPLAEGSAADINLQVSLYSSNATGATTESIGQNQSYQGSFGGLASNTGKCPISWQSNVRGTGIQVHRTGFYNISAVTQLSFRRDQWLSSSNGQINPDHANDNGNGFISGIKRHPKFTVALLNFELNTGADAVEDFISNKSLGELLFNNAQKYKEFDILTTEINELCSTSQLQFLKEGEVYYPVALMADEIYEQGVYQQLYGSTMSGWDAPPLQGSLSQYIQDNLLVSNGSIDYNTRHYFEIHSCDLTIELEKDPCPIAEYNAYYKPNPVITLSDLLPDISALDFVVEVSKIFNLVWTTNQKLQTASCEPYLDFYPEITRGLKAPIDWTEISYIESQKINTILPKKMDYKFLEDSSDKALQYFAQAGEDSVNFGDVSLNLNPSSTTNSAVDLKIFSTGRMNSAMGIFNEPDNAVLNEESGILEFDWTPYSVELITAYSEQNVPFYKSNHTKPNFLNSFNLKLASYGGRVSATDFKSLNGINNSNVTAAVKQYFEPLGDELEAEEASSTIQRVCIAKTYSSQLVGIPTTTFSNNKSAFGEFGGLYNTYHQGQIEMLKFSDRLIEAKVKLTPFDIHNLDFRRLIKIEENYFIISKIKNYDPSNEEPTTVELVLIHQRGTKEKL